MAIAFVYNALGIFLRSAFDCHDKQKHLLPLWLTLDYVCDVIYLMDIVAVQFHLSYSDRGLLVVGVPIMHATPHCMHTIHMHMNILYTAKHSRGKTFAARIIKRTFMGKTFVVTAS